VIGALAVLLAAVAPAPTFVARVDNPWFPLKPGTTFVYTGLEDGEATRDVVTVTHRTKPIQGSHATVVDDRVYHDGVLAERTSDWYAQDTKGNVWYLGEATAELDRKGHVTSTEGSWQAGVDGANGGMFMPAHPQVGQEFRQEYYKGHAEDRFRVLSVSAPVRVPYTGSRRGLLTKEWTRLEPGVVGHKYYVHGVGLVEERSAGNGKEHTQLVTVRRG